VKRFSLREVEKSRFVRAAIEAEVLRRAALACDGAGAGLLDAALERQAEAVSAGDYATFGALDYAFHQTLCAIARVDFAFEVISGEKAKLDRLCMLSLSKEDRMPQLLEDHRAMSDAIKVGDSAAAVAVGMLHLSRLDTTITAISTENADYFEPDAD